MNCKKTNSPLAALEPVIAKENGPFDAFRLARKTGLAPMEIGRTLVALTAAGKLQALGEAPEGSLAERFIRLEQPEFNGLDCGERNYPQLEPA